MANNILHIINKSPKDLQLTQCLRFCRQGDALLFIENGVYQLPTLPELELEIFALETDIAARGLQQRLPSQVNLIDYHGFVNLSAHYEVNQQW